MFGAGAEPKARGGGHIHRLAYCNPHHPQPIQEHFTAQCLISHITQLEAIVPPTNNAKQSAPKRAMLFGSARCVIPKTIEVKNENSNTVLK